MFLQGFYFATDSFIEAFYSVSKVQACAALSYTPKPVLRWWDNNKNKNSQYRKSTPKKSI